MDRLTSHDVVTLLLALGILLAIARILGELAQRLSQPAVLGELLAGILLGPTVAGRLAPKWSQTIFPSTGPIAPCFYGLVSLSIILFLLVAGMEVDLHAVIRQGRTAIRVAIGGIIVPFAVGFGAAMAVPIALGREVNTDPLIFALFFATAMSISALPVIAKTLMDLYLYRTDLGMVIIAAAIFNDLIGWIIFAVILGMIGASPSRHFSVGSTITLTLAFAFLMLTLGRWLLDKALDWLQAHTDWPAAVLTFVLTVALFAATFTEWCGVHAIFGSFLAGVAMGDSKRLGEKTRVLLRGFISFIFGPIFFASIGLQVDFIGYFRWQPVLIVLLIACAGKILGCGLAARSTGMSSRESWAIGVGMNSRGTMEIILGLLALQYEVIRQRMFVALVVMALVTSIMSGPLMQRILGRRRRQRLASYLAPGAFINDLGGVSSEQAIAELSQVLAGTLSWRREVIESSVIARERQMPTGVGNAVAVPHARLPGLSAPVIAVGLSRSGVDFSAPDGQPAQIILLLLTPAADARAQLDALSQIATELHNPDVRRTLLESRSFNEFVAALREH